MKHILHCSDSLFGNASLFTRWHLARGWRTIGYHFIILNGQLDSVIYNAFFNGWAETGRPINSDDVIDEWEQGSHVKGWNTNSIGTCLVGKSGRFTQEQILSARNLHAFLKQQFFELSLWQHGDFDPRKDWCAGLTMEQTAFIRGD